MPWDFHIHIVKDGQCHVMMALLNTRMRVVVRGSDMGYKDWQGEVKWRFKIEEYKARASTNGKWKKENVKENKVKI